MNPIEEKAVIYYVSIPVRALRQDTWKNLHCGSENACYLFFLGILSFFNHRV
jgi:hypothetical protein